MVFGLAAGSIEKFMLGKFDVTAGTYFLALALGLGFVATILAITTHKQGMVP